MDVIINDPIVRVSHTPEQVIVYRQNGSSSVLVDPADRSLAELFLIILQLLGNPGKKELTGELVITVRIKEPEIRLEGITFSP